MVITIINQKGGVAKTTTALNLGYALKNKGNKILFIDLDAQRNLTNTMQGLNADNTILELLGEKKPITDIVKELEKDKIYYISGSEHIGQIEQYLQLYHKGQTLRPTDLKDAIEPVRDIFDYIIIDTPPTLSQITINAIACSDNIIIPTTIGLYSMQGLLDISKTIDDVKNAVQSPINILGILLTRHTRTNLAKATQEQLKQVAENIGTELFDTIIRENIALNESTTQGTNIFDYDNKSNGAIDYNNLAEEIIRKGVNNE